MLPLIEAIIPAAVMAAVSLLVALKVSETKTEVRLAEVLRRLDAHEKTLMELDKRVCRRDEEMRGVHHEIKTLQGLTSDHTSAIQKLELQLARIEIILTRVEEKLDRLELVRK